MSHLRNHLRTVSSSLAEVADTLWKQSKPIHDRQDQRGSLIEYGRDHVERVEEAIWTLLCNRLSRSHQQSKDEFRDDPWTLFLLSVAACCHDFDKATDQTGLPHGEGSAVYLRENYTALGLRLHHVSPVEAIIRIHNCKEREFVREVQKLDIRKGGPDGESYNLRLLAVLLKAADILHCNSTRIAPIPIADPEHLGGLEKRKYNTRSQINGWKVDGGRILLEDESKSEEDFKVLKSSFDYMVKHEWSAVKDILLQYNFPYDLRLVSLTNGIKGSSDFSAVGAKRVTEKGPDRQDSECLPTPLPECLFSAPIRRDLLFQPLIEFATRRDIVFAFAGAGFELMKFEQDLKDYLEDNGIPPFTKIDLEQDIFKIIKDERINEISAIRDENARHSANIYRDLKCLFASLSYAACEVLRSEYPDGIERLIKNNLWETPAGFTYWYFVSAENSHLTAGSEVVEIVKYFFWTLQKMAESTPARVAVFMPLVTFAAWFHESEESTPDDLWKALRTFTISRKSNGAVHQSVDARLYGSGGPSEFDRVCLIVFTDQIPIGHPVSTRRLIQETIWPMPTLSQVEIGQLLGDLPGHLIWTDHEAEEILKATGGVPWLVRLVLTWLQYHIDVSRRSKKSPKSCTQSSIEDATQCIALWETLTGELGEFVREHVDMIRTHFSGPDYELDRVVQRASQGLTREQRRINVDARRIEKWLSTGLVCLDGDPWDESSDRYVFGKFQTVFLQRAGTLQEKLTDQLFSPTA